MKCSRAVVHHYCEEAKKELLSANKELSADEAMELIEEVVFNGSEELTLQECKFLVHQIYAKTRSKLGILDNLIDESDINEIMVDSPNDIFIEQKGEMIRLERNFDSVEELEEVIRNIAANVHREINELNPILDARLDDGSRVNAVYKNVAINGPALTIRKFSRDRITIEEMVKKGTLTQECADFLKDLIVCGYNLFISGGTSSGKTTFLNALSDYIPRHERVIVIEDSAELQLSNIDNLIQMECHNANTMGQGKISMDMLIKTSLRMRPDRIIVGEVRGREVSEMLQAMNTGHDGSMSTGHGNSVSGMLRRLEAMYLMSVQIPIDAVRAQLVEGIDVMIHLGRLDNGKRKVLEVQELVDFIDGKYVLQPLFLLNEQMELSSTGKKMNNLHKFRLKGKSYD